MLEAGMGEENREAIRWYLEHYLQCSIEQASEIATRVEGNGGR